MIKDFQAAAKKMWLEAAEEVPEGGIHKDSRGIPEKNPFGFGLLDIVAAKKTDKAETKLCAEACTGGKVCCEQIPAGTPEWRLGPNLGECVSTGTFNHIKCTDKDGKGLPEEKDTASGDKKKRKKLTAVSSKSKSAHATASLSDGGAMLTGNKCSSAKTEPISDELQRTATDKCQKDQKRGSRWVCCPAKLGGKSMTKAGTCQEAEMLCW